MAEEEEKKESAHSDKPESGKGETPDSGGGDEKKKHNKLLWWGLGIGAAGLLVTLFLYFKGSGNLQQGASSVLGPSGTGYLPGSNSYNPGDPYNQDYWPPVTQGPNPPTPTPTPTPTPGGGGTGHPPQGGGGGGSHTQTIMPDPTGTPGESNNFTVWSSGAGQSFWNFLTQAGWNKPGANNGADPTAFGANYRNNMAILNQIGYARNGKVINPYAPLPTGTKLSI